MAKILIVEDDESLNSIYTEYLSEETDFEIDSVKDGKKALNKLKEGGYDVVVMDLVMPEMDGLEVLEKLKDIKPKKKNGAIILLTNLPNGNTIEKAKKLGVKEYLIKADIYPDDLLRTIKKYL